MDHLKYYGNTIKRSWNDRKKEVSQQENKSRCVGGLAIIGIKIKLISQVPFLSNVVYIHSSPIPLGRTSNHPLWPLVLVGQLNSMGQ